MKLKPLNNSVVVLPIVEKVQENALFYSQNNMGEVQLAQVESCSDNQLKKGDKVIFFKYCACAYTIDAKKFLIVNFNDIIAKVEDENE